GRTEPGTGEISYRAVAAALAEMGYSGIVAMEAWASQASDVAIEQFLQTFSGNCSIDRKSTRLNTSHVSISYAVFCMKQKKTLIASLCACTYPAVSLVLHAFPTRRSSDLGRTEPGTGEISYRAVAAALAEMGYSGIVAMEAWASQASDVAIEQFLQTFSGNCS